MKRDIYFFYYHFASEQLREGIISGVYYRLLLTVTICLFYLLIPSRYIERPIRLPDVLFNPFAHSLTKNYPLLLDYYRSNVPD